MPSAKRLIPFLLCTAALPALALGCGIGTNKTYQEPLAKMRLSGTRAVGQNMRLELDYRQIYDVDVDVECDLKQGSEVVQQIGHETVPANASGSPDEAPTTGTFAFPFNVPKAGSYLVVCFTPADSENKLKTSLAIAAE